VRPGGTYASDVTDRKWALLAPLLPAPRPGGRLADDLPAAGGERDLLPDADRLLVADAAAGLPGLFYDAAQVLLTGS
jgi:transposase